ncbi:hypothetical protein SKAU_G00418430 [Synaphobranchus kaupii]|uniref:Ig-like domain-containing protein n=1 Tax=Synaphobranchus kaupii TaxID=118154 RepID=A0A9Q1E693_SYNKA|nr:hypothetical protein SKAU_G00418430 [Synaphobranchus kaupii]
MIEVERLILIGCLLQASPPKPKLTPEKVEVMEGTSVSLSCSAAAPCPKLPPNLTWTPSLSNSVDQLQENEDQTKSVSSVLTFTASHLHHGQKITCRALYKLQQGDIQKTSNTSLTIRVLYSPKNTSVSISPSGSVLEGSSVTLTCSSNGNPPVQHYTWYKVNGREMNTVGTGQNLTFTVTESSGSEQYYCEAQNQHGKENSTTVQLEVDYPPKNTSVFVSPSGSVLEGSSVTLTCSSNANPPVQHYTWYKVNGREMNTVGTGQNLTFNVTESSGSEQYYCEAQNKHGKENSTTVELKVDYPPKNTSAFISPSGSVLEGSSVTLTCSSNANPPVQHYTWYKVNGREMNTVGTGQNLTFNVIESSGSEQYFCEAQNEHGKDNSQLDIKYMPQISDSGSCSRTAAEISCSCESRGNPSPSMEWRVSGLRVINSTDRVISEDQLGNTGLRSSLTMRHSQGDTPTVLCLSTNILGSSRLTLHVPCPQQHSGLQSPALLYVIIAALICLYVLTVGFGVHKIKRLSRRLKGGRDGDTYASLQLPNISPEYDVLQVTSPPKPKLTPEKVEVMEGSSVSLRCSAAAPCPKLPPNLTWIPRLSDSVDQLQENEDQTKSVSSVLTFTASHLHHGQKITCRALYKLQQGDIQKTSEAKLTVKVLLLEGSSVTLTCSSNANPPVHNYTWYKVNGTEINTLGTGQNLTINVIESSGSEQYYCEAQNQHGKDNSTTVQLEVDPSPPKPKLTPEKVKVMEGSPVSLSCSAAAPCPKLPPNLTWTPRLSDSVDQLQENEDQTKSVSSVLTFTASHLHHGQKITCRALYKLQQGDIQMASEAKLTTTAFRE